MDLDPLRTFIVGTFAALALPFLLYGAVALVRQITGDRAEKAGDAIREREVAELRHRVAELEERLEFTERLLAREGREPAALPREEGR